MPFLRVFGSDIGAPGNSSGSRLPVRLASTGNVDVGVGGLVPVDGEATAEDDRILLWKQTDPTEVGLWLAKPGAWERTPDFDEDADVDLTGTVYVQEGDTYADRLFKNKTDPPVSIGVTAIVFALEGVDGPETVVSGNSVAWDGSDLKLLKDTGFSADAFVGSFGVPSAANMYVTNTDPRMVSLGGGDVVGPVGAVADNIAVYDGGSGKIIKDGGIALADLLVVTKSGRFPLNFVISGQSAPYFDTNSTSYQEACAFIFPGTTAIGTPTKIQAIFYRISGAAGTGEIRILDVTNSLVIAELTGVNTGSGVETIQDLGVISNLPAAEAIFEVQIRRQGGGSTWAVAAAEFIF